MEKEEDAYHRDTENKESYFQSIVMSMEKVTRRSVNAPAGGLEEHERH